MDAAGRIARLLVRADDLRKAVPGRHDPAIVRAQVAARLEEARGLLDEIPGSAVRLELAAAIARRIGDLDREDIGALLGSSPGVTAAPTRIDDPARVPPGQHLTAGFPVLHVGRAPELGLADVRVVVTGLVATRLVLGAGDLASFGQVEVTRDLHCVTSWTRLDNRWTGVRVRDVLARAGVAPAATHAVISGAPAYSASLTVDALTADDVLLAWAHDGRPLSPAHGGPLRLVVPARYGWKSVKWVSEIRLLDHEVPGYWEARGYHPVGDPWREQRFRGD